MGSESLDANFKLIHYYISSVVHLCSISLLSYLQKLNTSENLHNRRAWLGLYFYTNFFKEGWDGVELNPLFTEPTYFIFS